MEYIVSIVVPTKNRYKYIKQLISLVDSFHLDSLELVIQDNSDDNTEICQYLKKYESSNYIHYHYKPGKLTMAENCDLGVSNALGEYVCMIGDDDAICRNIVDCVRYLITNNIDGARTGTCDYYWPDYDLDQFNRSYGGKLFHSDINDTIDNVDSKFQLRRLLRHGFQYIGSGMPGMYNCIVRKSVLDAVRQKAGTYFPGASPDISISIAMSFYVDKYVNLHYPVVIGGISKCGGGGVLKKGKHVLTLDEVSFINPTIIEHWEKNLPPVWCGKYAWAESGCKTLKALGQESMLRQYNVDYTLANSVVFHRELFPLAYRYAKSKTRFLFYIPYIAYPYISRKVKRLFVKNNKQMQTIVTLPDMAAVEQYLYNKYADMVNKSQQ